MFLRRPTRPASLRCPMILLLLRRLGSLVVTLLLASLAIFLVLGFCPRSGGNHAWHRGAEDTLAALRQQMGLERPPHERYFDWLTGLLSGNSDFP